MFDALQISLWHRGVAMVVDPGTGSYYEDTRLRGWLASRLAHNAPCPEDEEWPQRLGPFLWARIMRLADLRVEADQANAAFCLRRTTSWNEPSVRLAMQPDCRLKTDAHGTTRAHRGERIARSAFAGSSAPGATLERVGRAQVPGHAPGRIHRDRRRPGVVGGSCSRRERHSPPRVGGCRRVARRRLPARCHPRSASSEWAPLLKLVAQPEPGRSGMFRTTFLATRAHEDQHLRARLRRHRHRRLPGEAGPLHRRRGRASAESRGVRAGNTADRRAGLDRAARGAKARDCCARRLRCRTRSRQPTCRLVCVGTPSNATGALDLRYVVRSCGEIAGARSAPKQRPHALVLRSTMLPGSTPQLVHESVPGPRRRRARSTCSTTPSSCARAPPSRTSSRRRSPSSGPRRRAAAAGVDCTRLFGDGAAVVDWETAEMVKYACNAFHATKIAFANEIGRVGKSVGVDARAVMDLLCQDTRLKSRRSTSGPATRSAARACPRTCGRWRTTRAPGRGPAAARKPACPATSGTSRACWRSSKRRPARGRHPRPVASRRRPTTCARARWSKWRRRCSAAATSCASTIRH